MKRREDLLDVQPPAWTLSNRGWEPSGLLLCGDGFRSGLVIAVFWQRGAVVGAVLFCSSVVVVLAEITGMDGSVSLECSP